MGLLRQAPVVLASLALACAAASADDPSWIRIFTVAGGGDGRVSAKDGAPATRADMVVNDIAALPDGSFLVADRTDVQRVGRDGVTRTVAGTGTAGLSGDGGPAVRARLEADSVAALPDGGFLIADWSHRRVREVRRDGTIATVAGTGEQGFSGDGGPAVQARVTPADVAALPDGGFLIAEATDVRRVAADGTISTVAGADATVDAPPLRDHGPALGARMHPTDVAALPDGGFLIADADARVLAVDRDGIVTTAAGAMPAEPDAGAPVGASRPAGHDGDLAVGAALGTPLRVAALPDSAFLVADRSSVRLVAGSAADRLGLALDDQLRDRVYDYRYVTHVSLSRPAFVRISIWSGRTQVGEGAMTVPRQGWFAVSAWGGFEPGIYTVLVSAATGDGAKALQTRRVVLGGLLSDEWAVALVGGDERTRVLHSRPEWAGWAARSQPARAADSGPFYRSVLCRRFSARRVDCEIQISMGEGDEGPYRCGAVDAIVLGRDGQLHGSTYACPTPRHPRLFKRHPPKLIDPDEVIDLSRLDQIAAP